VNSYRGRLSREVLEKILGLIHYLNLDRNDELRLLNNIYRRLETVTAAIRAKRVPNDPNCFRTVVAYQHERVNYALFLTVDDTTTSGEMLVREVQIRSWPASPPL
jgi:hypothetical protein